MTIADKKVPPNPGQGKTVDEDVTPDKLARFDAASNHPYECRCELCKEWWSMVPEEE